MNNHNTDTYHSDDKVFKESFTLFKGKSLSFLDSSMDDSIIDVMTNEYTETRTKKLFTDLVFKISDKKARQFEWEHHVSTADLMRFCSYNIDWSRDYPALNFETVIITNTPPSVREYTNSSVIFQPKIVVLSERDADATISKLNQQLENGEPINELELLYLPMYTSPSGKSKGQLFDIAVKLSAKSMDISAAEKVRNLLILLVSKHISPDEFNKILEENTMLLDNDVAVKVIGDRRAEKLSLEVALKLLKKGVEATTIAEALDKPLSWVEKLVGDGVAR